MGVDFSHGNAHFGYTSFRQFRQTLANTVGIDLNDMEGFGGMRPWSEIEDPLVPFLSRNDYDGYLTVDECSAVIQRVKEIQSDKKAWYPMRSEPWEEVLDGLEEAVRRGEPLKWG